MLVLLGAALIAAGCADEGLTFEGETGQKTPLTLTNWIPRVPVSLDGVEGLALLDTGAPLTIAFSGAFSALKADSTARVEGRAFGLRFPALDVGVLAGGGPGTCAEPQHGAILGQDVLGRFRLHVDYRGKRAFLNEPGGQEPQPTEVDAPVHIKGQRLGRGYISFGDVGVDVGRSRLVVDVEVEGTRVKALVDTGASLTVISDKLLARLGGSPTRPALCCTAVQLLKELIESKTVRLEQMTIGAPSADNVEVRNVAALVLPDAPLLTALTAETGEKIEMIIGANPMRRFALDIDLDAATLTLSRYRDTSHIDADEYVLPGFSFCKSRDNPDAMRVIDVFAGSDAKRLGVPSGALFIAVNGQPVANMSAGAVIALLHKTPVGQTVTITFRAASGGATSERKIAIERLLGDYK